MEEVVGSNPTRSTNYLASIPPGPLDHFFLVQPYSLGLPEGQFHEFVKHRLLFE